MGVARIRHFVELQRLLVADQTESVQNAGMRAQGAVLMLRAILGRIVVIQQCIP